MNEVQVQVKELGLQEYTDATGETIFYYAIQFTARVEDQEYHLVTSLDPDTVPGDPEYAYAIEQGKRRLLAKALQEVGNDPTEQSAS